VARSLKIRGEEAEITVELGAGPTAEALWEVLPLESRASLWGQEIYFPIALSVEDEPDAREEIEVGRARVHTLHEDGKVITEFHEGGSEEAERIRLEAQQRAAG
jgi:hypothetical protein